MLTDLYLSPCDHKLLTYPLRAARAPRIEYARDGEGRWWYRQYELRYLGWRHVATCVEPWTLMGDVRPVTGEAPPGPSVKHPRAKARLPENHLAKIGIK